MPVYAFNIFDLILGGGREPVSESNPQPSPSPDGTTTQGQTNVSGRVATQTNTRVSGETISESNPQPMPGQNIEDFKNATHCMPPDCIDGQNLVSESNPQPSPSPRQPIMSQTSNQRQTFFVNGTKENDLWVSSGFTMSIMDSNNNQITEETLDMYETMNTYTGSLKEPFGLGALSYKINFNSGKKTYVIRIGFDAEFTKFGQFVLNGQKTRGVIHDLDLVFDNYSEAMDTLSLIKDYHKGYVANTLDSYSDFSINFKSHDCEMSEMKESSMHWQNYYNESAYKNDKKVIAQLCKIDMTDNSDDYFSIGGYLAYWSYSMGWDWQN